MTGVGEDLDDQPAVKPEAGHRVALAAASRSIGFVQKCGCGGTVGPRHSTTRVRTSVIFMSAERPSTVRR